MVDSSFLVGPITFQNIIVLDNNRKGKQNKEEREKVYDRETEWDKVSVKEREREGDWDQK